jgi:ABC-type lipoprotein release transport system permease subunit
MKGWADLWGRRWQSIVIVVTVAAAAALLYIGLVSFSAVSSPYDRLMDRTNGPHATFFLGGPDRGAAMAGRLAVEPGVTAAELRDAFETYLVIPGNESNAGVLVTSLSQSAPALMGYEIVAGRDLSDGPGEGVLGVSLARNFGIHAGDTVQVAGPDGAHPLKVVGLSADPIFCPYPSCVPQSLFVRPATFATVVGAAPGRIGLFGVRLADPASADRFVSRALKDAGETKVHVGFSWLTMRSGNQLMQGVGVMSLMVVALTAIIAAALMTANIIGGAVLGQYREIAVLKTIAEPLLLPYDHSSVVALEVQRLLRLLALFLPASKDLVPDNSLLREFTGGSIFEKLELAGSAKA